MTFWFRGRRRHPMVAIIGDSLASGEHASARGCTWAALTLRTLASQVGGGLTSRVIAVPGAGVRDLLNRGLPLASRVVVVEAGTNDWMGSAAGWRPGTTPLPDFAAAYLDLLDRVDDGRAATVICLGIWGPSWGCGCAGVRLEDYDAVIRDTCQVRDAHFAPLSSVYEDPRSRGPGGLPTPFGRSDEMHPNDHGHARIAELVLEAIASRGGAPSGAELHPAIPAAVGR